MVDRSVPLPDSVMSFVDEQVAGGEYGSDTEYLGELVRREQAKLERREQAKQRLRALIQEGLDSPIVGPADQAYFDGLRAFIRAEAAKKGRSLLSCVRRPNGISGT